MAVEESARGVSFRDARTPMPDLDRVGGMEWTLRTRGRVTRAERRRLLAAIARTHATHLAGLPKLALGVLPRRAHQLTIEDFVVPDSRFAREAEAACEEQPLPLARHAYRTWLFGLALARLDQVRVDTELLYVASLLHDTGLTRAVLGQDFTLRSAARAAACAASAGVGARRATLLADAITAHTTPGLNVERDGALAAYLQAGSLLDVVGVRLWDLPRPLVGGIVARHSREGFKPVVTDLIRSESMAVPRGRFAFATRCGLLAAIRLAPLPG